MQRTLYFRAHFFHRHPCFWFTLLFLVYTLISGLHSCFWYALLFLVYTLVSGLHSCFWFTHLFVVYTLVCGLHSCFWFTLLFLVYTIVSGLHSCFPLLNYLNIDCSGKVLDVLQCEKDFHIFSHHSAQSHSD